MSPKKFRVNRRACTSGKRRFMSEIEAQMTLLRIQSYEGANAEHVPVRCYECPECHGWHLTSLPAWKEAPA